MDTTIAFCLCSKGRRNCFYKLVRPAVLCKRADAGDNGIKKITADTRQGSVNYEFIKCSACLSAVCFNISVLRPCLTFLSHLNILCLFIWHNYCLKGCVINYQPLLLQCIAYPPPYHRRIYLIIKKEGNESN